jgi:hypothetical protein
MAQVGRLAGAILAETQGQFFLVGNPKEPCDFSAAGFEPPGTIDALARPFIRLTPCGSIQMSKPCMKVAVEGDALPKLLVDRFLIQRNGSVSDRLWRLVMESAGTMAGNEAVDARWLGEMPVEIWNIVRDTVLKCT